MQNTPNSAQARTELTALQSILPRHCVSRDIEMVDDMLHGILNIDEKIRELAASQNEVVILDVGCGSGAAIEERVRRQQALLRRDIRNEIKLTGVGIDINPIPHLIPSGILSIDPENGLVTNTDDKKYSLMASIRKDDVTKLETVPSNSVDILYSIAVLAYEPDVLKALEECWRVLKPGGIMCHQSALALMANPDFNEILRFTKGAHTFNMKQNYLDDFWLATKDREAEKYFRGFPYRMTGVSKYSHTDSKGLHAYRNHFRIGQYKSTEM